MIEEIPIDLLIPLGVVINDLGSQGPIRLSRPEHGEPEGILVLEHPDIGLRLIGDRSTMGIGKLENHGLIEFDEKGVLRQTKKGHEALKQSPVPPPPPSKARPEFEGDRN